MNADGSGEPEQLTFDDADDELATPSWINIYEKTNPNNLIANPGFESQKVGWSDPEWSDPATITTTEDAHTGDRSLKAHGPGWGSIRKTQWLEGEGGGKTYKLTACGKRVGGTDRSVVSAEEYPATIDSIDDKIAIHSLVFDSDSWQCKTTTFTTDNDTDKIPVSIFLGDGSDGEDLGNTQFFVDDITLEEIPDQPNCTNLSGPTQLIVGETGTYSAEFYSPEGDLRGMIGIGGEAKRDDNFNVIGEVGPSSNSHNLSISDATWTPDQPGSYLISCRAWNDARAECRYQDHVDGPPRYVCQGPDNYLQVQVVDGECTSDNDCANNQFCNPNTNECVDCLTDAHCQGDHSLCSSNHTCSCETGFTDCSGANNDSPMCVDTQTDENHCGACNTSCASNEICQNGSCVQEDECTTANDCTASNECKIAGCDTSSHPYQCTETNKANGTSCDGGNGECQNGSCEDVGSVPTSCNDVCQDDQQCQDINGDYVCYSGWTDVSPYASDDPVMTVGSGQTQGFSQHYRRLYDDQNNLESDLLLQSIIKNNRFYVRSAQPGKTWGDFRELPSDPTITDFAGKCTIQAFAASNYPSDPNVASRYKFRQLVVCDNEFYYRDHNNGAWDSHYSKFPDEDPFHTQTGSGDVQAISRHMRPLDIEEEPVLQDLVIRDNRMYHRKLTSDGWTDFVQLLVDTPPLPFFAGKCDIQAFNGLTYPDFSHTAGMFRQHIICGNYFYHRDYILADAGRCRHPSYSGSTSCNQVLMPSWLTLRVKLAGVPYQEGDNYFHPVKSGREFSGTVTLISAGGNNQAYNIPFNYDLNSKNYISQQIDLGTLQPGPYAVSVKGPKHRSTRFCYQGGQASRICSLSDFLAQANALTNQSDASDINFIWLAENTNNVLDLSAQPLQAGDLPISGNNVNTQDGVVDVFDYSFLFNCLQNRDDEACVSRADLNYSGFVDNIDLGLLRETLSKAVDEL